MPVWSCLKIQRLWVLRRFTRACRRGTSCTKYFAYLACHSSSRSFTPVQGIKVLGKCAAVSDVDTLSEVTIRLNFRRYTGPETTAKGLNRVDAPLHTCASIKLLTVSNRLSASGLSYALGIPKRGANGPHVGGNRRGQQTTTTASEERGDTERKR